MICKKCFRQFDNKKSFSNHFRWCYGLMEKSRINYKLSKMGNKNPNWRGNKKINIFALHNWVNRNINRPKVCEKCGSEENIDLANKGIYNRDFKNWNYLCRSCHMEEDGRLNKLHKFYRRNYRAL